MPKPLKIVPQTQQQDRQDLQQATRQQEQQNVRPESNEHTGACTRSKGVGTTAVGAVEVKRGIRELKSLGVPGVQLNCASQPVSHKNEESRVDADQGNENQRGSLVEDIQVGHDEAVPPDVVAKAIGTYALVDRLGEDVGELAPDMAFKSQEIDPKKLDPSRYKDVFEDPKSFDEAWNHPDLFQREKWRDAIMKEFSKMEVYI